MTNMDKIGGRIMLEFDDSGNLNCAYLSTGTYDIQALMENSFAVLINWANQQVLENFWHNLLRVKQTGVSWQY